MNRPNDNVIPVLPLDCLLGEGLHWDVQRRALWSVDIHGRRVILWDGRSVAWREWRMPERVGWVIPEHDGPGVLLGLQSGFARAELGEAADVHVQHIVSPFEGRHELRLNDGKADTHGAVWAGSLNNEDEGRADGCLYRLAPDGTLTTVDTGYTVANGPAISPDGRLFLHTDSGRRTIYAFDLHGEEGRLSNKRVWKQFVGDEGYPDGMCFDAEGCVWVAHWGAACISRFDPAGQLLRRIFFPASLITNVCFGGEGLDRLFVSSAHVALQAAERAEQPHAGSLFEVIEPGTRGVPGGRSPMHRPKGSR